MHKYFNVEENKVACWVHPHPFDAERKTLVFIHGAGGNSDLWKLQCIDLSSTFNIAAIDLPGHGESGGRAAQSIAEYARQLKNILDVLEPINPILVGHSMGAAIAQCFAAKYSAEIQGFVLVGGGIKMPVNPNIIEGLQRQPEATMDLICKFAIAKENHLKLLSVFRENLVKTKNEVLASDMLACDKFDSTDELRKIATPTLVICGLQDRMTPPEFSKQLAAAVKSATLVLIEGAGHMVMMEQPEQFNQIVQDFCRRTNK
jgi:pimeloyl-ACP methyl ester carboxylesterase